MIYKLPEPVQIDKHIPTGIVIRGYKAQHVLDAYTAGVTQTKAKLKSEIEQLKTYNNELEQINFVLLDHNKKDQENLIQQINDLKQDYANSMKHQNCQYNYRVAERDSARLELEELKQEIKQLQFELDVINSRE